MIAHRGASAGAPVAFDVDVAIAARLPPALFVDVAGALALVVTVAPDPVPTVTDVVALDEDEPWADFHRHDARRRWLFLDLDDGDGRRDMAMCFHHARARACSERGRESETSESILKLHTISFTPVWSKPGTR